jgi:hypothetical protein
MSATLVIWGLLGPSSLGVTSREDSSFMKERLDRAVANPSWCDKFQDVDVLCFGYPEF